MRRKEIRKRVLEHHSIQQDESSSQIRVLAYNRSDIRRRTWRNKIDSLFILRENPKYEDKYISEMPSIFSKQIELFSNTDVVVTPHGAALANSIFIELKAHIIEVHKCCKQEVRLDSKSHRIWTAWHACRATYPPIS